MKKNTLQFSYEEYNSIDELSEIDASLLQKARDITKAAYAPYSNFFVGSAALLSNQEVITGTNQENASYPVTICAERTLLSALSAIYPNTYIKTMAISYHNQNVNKVSNKPISPCGMCRQALLEFETRFQKPIRLILSGFDGKVLIIDSANDLLPFSFTKEFLSKSS